jgi:hypothetical protein
MWAVVIIWIGALIAALWTNYRFHKFIKEATWRH